MIFRFVRESMPWGSKRRTHIFLIVAVCFFGSALRFNQIDSQSLWFDELHSIIPVDPANTLASVVEYSKSDQSPIFFIMLYGWYQVFPYDEASGKVFCAILGILGIISMYFLGREFRNPEVGLVSAFLTSFNLFHLYYSQELRFYSLLFLISSLSFLAFLRFCRNPTINNQLLFIGATVGLLYTHYYGMVVVLSQGIIFLIIHVMFRKDWIFLLKGLACAVISLILFIPWIPVIMRDVSVTSFWIVDPGPLFIAEYFNRYFNGWWGLALKVVFSWTLFGLIVVFLWRLISDLNKRFDQETILPQVILVGWALLTLLIPYLYTVFRMPMLQDRYTIITLPSILLMISIGWTRLNSKPVQWVFVLIFIFFTWRADHRYFSRFKKPQYRELSQAIITQNSNNSPVISLWAWHFNYFFKKFNAGYQVRGLHEIDFAALLEKEERFWVIFPQYHLSQEQGAMLNSSFSLVHGIQLEGASANLYEKKK